MQCTTFLVKNSKGKGWHSDKLYFVCNPLIFSRQEPEYAEMAAVFPYVFRHFAEGLSEVNDTAVSMPAVDQIVDDDALVAFTAKVVENDDLLVVHRKLLQRDNFVTGSLNNLVTDLKVDPLSSKSCRRAWYLLWCRFFREDINFIAR